MSALFDNMLPPAVRNRIAMEKELARRRDIWTHPTLYKGAGDLLLKHGEFYEGQQIPQEFEHLIGAEQQCFLNALHAAEADPRLTYCEGIWATGSGHFTTHAWCVYDRKVVEVTAPTEGVENYSIKLGPGQSTVKMLPVERWGYWGLRVAAPLVRQLCDLHELPILDRPSEDEKLSEDWLDCSDDRTAWPILEHPYSPTRTSI
jgi:hypothetical protein